MLLTLSSNLKFQKDFKNNKQFEKNMWWYNNLAVWEPTTIAYLVFVKVKIKCSTIYCCVKPIEEKQPSKVQ